MLSRLFPTPKVFSGVSWFYSPIKTQLSRYRISQFPAISQAIHRPNRVFVGMASGGQKFPPQKQNSQPGKRHVMDPTPQRTNPDYKPSNKLQGKVAVVTGGDSGIGRAVCFSFVIEGATVAFTCVKAQEDKDADDTLQMLKTHKTADAKDPIAIPMDLGFDENCKRVVDEVVNAYGRIDILVNNAAERTSVALWRRLMSRGLKGHALEHMKEDSSIINTTSVNAYKGNSKLFDYTSTKGAIVAFIRGLALQLVSRGIRVNVVAPGPIWTPLIPASFKEEVANFGKQVPMQRAGQPAEVAPSYVFLACNHCSSYITGQVLHPNGKFALHPSTAVAIVTDGWLVVAGGVIVNG